MLTPDEPQCAAPVEDLTDFDSLIADVLEDPEILLKKDFTTEQLLEMQKRLNAHGHIACAPPENGKKKIAAVSYTNIKSDYLRREAATSLVAFLFQMLNEWTVPVEHRRWVPAKKAAVEHKPFDPEDLVKQLSLILDVAKEARDAANSAAELKRVAAELSVVSESTDAATAIADSDAKYADAQYAESRSLGLLYVATHMTHRLGLEATDKLHVTAKTGLKYPEVKEIISRTPLPTPPGQLEIPADNAKAIIDNFVRHWFTFDPSVHVRSGHDLATIAKDVQEAVRVDGEPTTVDTADPGHLTLKAVLASRPTPAAEHKDAVDVICQDQRNYNAVTRILRDEDLTDATLEAIRNLDTFKQYLFPVVNAKLAAENVPPQDTFHRWSYYTEVNYEEIRTITEALYPERVDIDWAVALWDVFEGTQTEVDAAFEKHCQRYQDELPSTIKALQFGGWTPLADFKENRKNVQFYNKHTEILKRILNRHADDKRIGAELMRNRVRQTKARNIAEAGPDAEGLSNYKRVSGEQGHELGAKGGEKVISQEEMKRLEKARGSVKAAKELELLDQLRKSISDFNEEKSKRELTFDETRELESLRDQLKLAEEMVEVPDDAIQVDMFVTDGRTGEFTKKHMYTKAEEPTHLQKDIAADGSVAQMK